MLATISWALSLNEERIAPGDSRQIAKVDAATAPDEKEIVVFWWRAVHENGERVPGEIQSIAVSFE